MIIKIMEVTALSISSELFGAMFRIGGEDALGL